MAKQGKVAPPLRHLRQLGQSKSSSLHNRRAVSCPMVRGNCSASLMDRARVRRPKLFGAARVFATAFSFRRVDAVGFTFSDPVCVTCLVVCTRLVTPSRRRATKTSLSNSVTEHTTRRRNLSTGVGACVNRDGISVGTMVTFFATECAEQEHVS